MATYFHPMCFRWSKKNLLTLNEYNLKGSTLLCLAVKLQRVECSILLLSNGADPNLFDKNDFIKHILAADENVKKNFQTFLKSNLLSSHLWIIGRKK